MRAMLLLIALWTASTPPQDIGWLKLDQAKAIGAHSGKLILVYVACDPKSGSAPCSGGASERSFSDPAILKRQDDFHFVRVCEKKTAMSVRASRAPEAIFLDPDGDEVYRSGFTDGGTLDRAMTAAVQKYGPREVVWASDVPTVSGKSLVIIGFDDEKGEALKAFEDKTLVKLQDRIEFVKLPFKKDGEAAKKWGVTQAPAIIICDGTKEAPEKNTIERLLGKKTPAALKVAIVKALAKIEPKK
ncbi:MAG TPA: hypothetical protein VNM14_02450 [Planctomycetota bacterium]|nr:hypothetical protein [Planctomycetota bacterium]